MTVQLSNDIIKNLAVLALVPTAFSILRDLDKDLQTIAANALKKTVNTIGSTITGAAVGFVVGDIISTELGIPDLQRDRIAGFKMTSAIGGMFGALVGYARSY